MRAILEQSAVAVPLALREPGVLGRADFSVGVGERLGVPPTVELEIADRNVLLTVTFDEGEERAGVTFVRVVVVVIARAVVGPVAEVFADDVGVIRGSLLAVKIRQCA